MLPARNTGMLLSGNAFDKRVSWAGGVFNNWLDDDLSISDSATQFVGRLTAIPLVSRDESSIVHLGLGLRATNAKRGVRYFTEPEFNLAPVFVDTGELPADSAYTWDLEAAWRRGPLWLSGEYLKTHVDSPSIGDPTFSGYYFSGIWALTGEMRDYNKRSGVFGPPPVARSVYQGGWGAWELMFRYSSVDLADGVVDGGRMNILSAGLRWWLTRFISVDMNIRRVDLRRAGVDSESSAFNTRLVLSLE